MEKKKYTARPNKKRHYDSSVPGIKVDVEKIGDFEKALRIFTKKFQASGVLKVLKDKEQFTSPGQKRRFKHLAAISRENKRKNGRPESDTE